MSALGRLRGRRGGTGEGEPPGPGRLRRGGGRLGAGVRRFLGWFATGVPRGLVAVAAIVVLFLTLYTVATRESQQAKGWAEFTMFRLGCAVDPDRRHNVLDCVRTGP